MGQRRVSQGCKPGAVDIRALIEQVSHPFDAVSLPLSYSDNPGVNGVSDRGKIVYSCHARCLPLLCEIEPL